MTEEDYERTREEETEYLNWILERGIEVKERELRKILLSYILNESLFSK